LPFNVLLGADANDDGDAGSDRPALTGGSLAGVYAASGAARIQYLIPRSDASSVLGIPRPITDPAVAIGRNAFSGPPLRFYDLSLSKRLALGERQALTLDVNAFNVFNITNFANPVATLTSAFFGRVSSTRGNPRQFQFGAKFSF
jgi:hypothetical protein